MNLKDILYVFFCAMVPLIELRGSILIGVGLDLPIWLNYIVSVIGNIIPVPFILLFIRGILSWMLTVPKLSKIAEWVHRKADKNKEKVLKYATFGLYIFVAIPLPGTGAWTGALIAAMLDMPLKKAFPSIALGVLGAGIIISFVSYGATAIIMGLF